MFSARSLTSTSRSVGLTVNALRRNQFARSLPHLNQAAGFATGDGTPLSFIRPPPPPGNVRIHEVGARDGLQNEKTIVPSEVKVSLIKKLLDAGITTLEATSFVSPKWVPQMSDAHTVLTTIPNLPDVTYNVLTPNIQGFESALAAAKASDPPKRIEVTVFGGATESFSKANLNSSIEQAVKKFRVVCERAKEEGIPVRCAVSVAVDCPFEGAVDPSKPAHLAKLMYDMGCFEIAVCDTTGRGTPGAMKKAIRACVEAGVPIERIAVHCHDTFGMGVANTLAAVEEGVRIVDSSVAGLGGCPYSPGATGNVSTEDVVYMLHGLGFNTGIDLDKLVDAGDYISKAIGRRNDSKVGTATLVRRTLKVDKPAARKETARM
ncbi:hypothetical protein HDU93_008135 [Gonapodya sp. JEL0774]|nr:hypothetical protein HDU93_008135 [Gonapodya sp. JEL0774]